MRPSTSCGACSTSTGSTLAEEHLARAMELTDRAEFIGFSSYQQMEQARLDLARAHWDDALAALEPQPEPAPCPLRRADRRGHRAPPPGRRRRRRRCSRRRVASPTTSASCSGADPVAAARAEAALLRGDVDAARAIARPEFDEADRRQGCEPARRARVLLLRRAGDDVDVAADDPHPFAVQARGDWRRAADLWRAAGCAVPRGGGARREPRRRGPARRARDPRSPRRGATGTTRACRAPRPRRAEHPARAVEPDPAQPRGPDRPAGRRAAAARRRADERRDRRAPRGVGAHGRQPCRGGAVEARGVVAAGRGRRRRCARPAPA